MAKKRKRKHPVGWISIRMLDVLWRKAVLLKYGGKCMACDAIGKGLNVHHIVDRRNTGTRHLVTNGAILCPSHHKFNTARSAHCNPVWFVYKLNTCRGIVELDNLMLAASDRLSWTEDRVKVKQYLLERIAEYE